MKKRWPASVDCVISNWSGLQLRSALPRFKTDALLYPFPYSESLQSIESMHVYNLSECVPLIQLWIFIITFLSSLYDFLACIPLAWVSLYGCSRRPHISVPCYDYKSTKHRLNCDYTTTNFYKVVSKMFSSCPTLWYRFKWWIFPNFFTTPPDIVSSFLVLFPLVVVAIVI